MLQTFQLETLFTFSLTAFNKAILRNQLKADVRILCIVYHVITDLRTNCRFSSRRGRMWARRRILSMSSTEKFGYRFPDPPLFSLERKRAYRRAVYSAMQSFTSKHRIPSHLEPRVYEYCLRYGCTKVSAYHPR